MDKTVLHTGRGAIVWNSLPSNCKKANSFQSIKMKLKTMLAEQQEMFVFNCLLPFPVYFGLISSCEDSCLVCNKYHKFCVLDFSPSLLENISLYLKGYHV